MSDQTMTRTVAEDPEVEAISGEVSGAAGFAFGESAEILNLLSEQESGSGCCGGNCCSA